MPSKPTSLVQRVDSETQLWFSQLQNYSPITSYSLEFRKGTTGDFTTYSGPNEFSTMMTKFTIKSPWVSKGNTYSFRFRAKNAYGWSPYSDIVYLIVAESPGRPSKLILSSFSSTQIVLEIPSVQNDGGSSITSMALEYAEGLTSSSFSPFPSCSFGATTCSIGTAQGLTTGRIYKFRHTVTNIYGTSDYSDVLSVGLVTKPSAVTGLARVDSLSTKTSIGLTWDLIADSNSPAGVIRGYRVYMINPSISNSQTLVYDGYGFSKTNIFVVPNLITSQEYRFTVSAIDFNGEGDKSAEFTIFACVAPSGVPRPQRVSSTTTQIVIKWGGVSDTGG